MLFRDLGTAVGRSVSASRPDARSVSGFVGEEVLASGTGWTAGWFSAWFVGQFFVERSWKNLWGLTATKRTALASDDYSLLSDVVGYLVGLVVLLVVRQLIIGTLHHLRDVQSERADQGAP
ncbi:MAG: hypothetical protein AAGA48_04870 [Myxococcota bacterium]